MKLLKKILAGITGTAIMLTSAFATAASAEQVLTGYKGDLNGDITLTSDDVDFMGSYLNGDSSPLYGEADMNDDGVVNVYDYILLKRCLTNLHEWIGIYTQQIDDTFISPPITAINSSLSSQGNSSLVIFYIDFPDCQFSQKLSAEEIEQISFGSADESSSNYPFESMSAFYSRSSKGTMNLTGSVFSYTAKNSISTYNNDKEALAKECFEAFKDSVDFSIYDGNGDGRIDATLFTVPESASDDYWWPCSGPFADSDYTVDGVTVGNIITGNCVPTNVMDFNSSYLHEMGHCMGLPDYYLYTSDDFDSMHGKSGTELMDADAYSDFSSFSKLMLGWYKQSQIQVYDSSQGTQIFTLKNAQTDEGNCVIIPYGTLADDYCSEYFIIEYSTIDGNNSGIYKRGWGEIESGIRIHHVKADITSNGWWSFFKYENGSEYTNNDDDGIRLIRLVNESENASPFTTGSVIDSNTSGFGWYDSNENESIDPGVSITVGDLENDQYTITISSTN